jgi:hypothetical protein
MKEDRPIWLTSLAEADHGAMPHDAIEARLRGELNRRRVMNRMKRSGAVGLAAALAIGLWLAPKRQAVNEVDVASDNVLDAINEAASFAFDDDAISDFVPTQLASEQPLESVRVVRVSLPGGALARYGFPTSEVSTNADVTADLLVGQDGIARAIRVVK